MRQVIAVNLGTKGMGAGAEDNPRQRILELVPYRILIDG